MPSRQRAATKTAEPDLRAAAAITTVTLSAAVSAAVRAPSTMVTVERHAWKRGLERGVERDARALTSTGASTSATNVADLLPPAAIPIPLLQTAVRALGRSPPRPLDESTRNAVATLAALAACAALATALAAIGLVITTVGSASLTACARTAVAACAA